MSGKVLESHLSSTYNRDYTGTNLETFLGLGPEVPCGNVFTPRPTENEESWRLGVSILQSRNVKKKGCCQNRARPARLLGQEKISRPSYFQKLCTREHQVKIYLSWVWAQTHLNALEFWLEDGGGESTTIKLKEERETSLCDKHEARYQQNDPEVIILGNAMGQIPTLDKDL